ncbi:MAG: hypothetical protein GQ534_00290, partial [Candidatus Delongbacteria bacterium]|nr:hypothetical protein [Candidatus Delongbacteria bacterium]
MRLNIRLIIFILVSFSFFSICLAEDFWVKLGWNEKTHRIFCIDNDEIFINSNRLNFKSLDGGSNWDSCSFTNTGSLLFYDKITEEFYLYGDGNLLSRVHKDSNNTIPLIQMYLTGLENYDSEYYIFGTSKIIKTDTNFTELDTVLSVEGEEYFCSIIKGIDSTLITGSMDFLGESGIYLSYDNGNSWSEIIALYDHYITSMSIDSEGRIFVGTSGHST